MKDGLVAERVTKSTSPKLRKREIAFVGIPGSVELNSGLWDAMTNMPVIPGYKRLRISRVVLSRNRSADLISWSRNPPPVPFKFKGVRVQVDLEIDMTYFIYKA